MAVEYKDGVVFGADSRATTVGHVINRVCNKLIRLTDFIYCCSSGTAAHAQAVTDMATCQLEFQQIEFGEPALVATATNIIRQICYIHRKTLSAGFVIAGWDKKLGGQAYSVTIGGVAIRQAVSIAGFGFVYVYGFVDANFKEDMSKEEAIDFVTKTLALNMGRDANSGGVVRLGVITKDGMERHCIPGNQLPKFYEG